MKTSQKEISLLIKEICDLSGLKNSKALAIQHKHKAYLAYDYAPIYGGYRLIMVRLEGGGQYGAFGYSSTEPRDKARVFAIKLRGIIAGLNYDKAMFDNMAKEYSAA